MLSHTPILRCAPSLSRQIKGSDHRTENGYKNSYKNGHKNGYKNGYKNGRFHVSLLRTVYTFTARTGHPGAVRPQNITNANLGRYLKAINALLGHYPPDDVGMR
jgi:hypothetical protein